MFFLGRQKKFNVTSGFLQPILFELFDVLSAGQMPVLQTFVPLNSLSTDYRE